MRTLHANSRTTPEVYVYVDKLYNFAGFGVKA